METKKKATVGAKVRIRVQLDYKTIVILKNKNALPLWRARFPEARITGTV